jgi:UDP-N-acetylmuramate dehydrogenase
MFKIQQNTSLRSYNSFHFDVLADYFVDIESVDDMQQLIVDPIFVENKKLIVWWGSNMLLTQERFDGLVIHNQIVGKEILHQEDDFIVVRVGAGEIWHDFVMRAVWQGLGGIENLALIPGSVWAAPMQNIGAYGVEVKDVIEFVEYVDLSDGSTHVLDNGSCQFGYRDSVFKRDLKDRAFISHVVFKLYKTKSLESRDQPRSEWRGKSLDKSYTSHIGSKWQSYQFKLDYKDIQQEIGARKLDIAQISVQDVADIVTTVRRRKLPDWTQIGTAGSFFKNPVVSVEEFQRLKGKENLVVGYEFLGGMKLSAGQLIELAGLKWIEKWSVGTYKNHALVLVHHGWGKGSDIVALAKEIQEAVYAKFSVWLDPEVNYIE